MKFPHCRNVLDFTSYRLAKAANNALYTNQFTVLYFLCITTLTNSYFKNYSTASLAWSEKWTFLGKCGNIIKLFG